MAEVIDAPMNLVNEVSNFPLVSVDFDDVAQIGLKSEPLIEIVGAGHTSASDIGGVSRYGTLIIAHELIIMGIMDGAGDDPAGFPTERHFALCAPHLVAAANFEDALAARRAGFGIFLEEGGGFHVVLVANVALFFDFAALGTYLCFAHLAFPSS